MDEKALIAERVKLFDENKTLVDSASGTLNGEQQAKFDERNARINEIRGTLDRAESLRAEERLLAESRGRRTESVVNDGSDKPSDADREQALRAWALGRYATPSQLAAAQRCGLSVTSPEQEVNTEIRKDRDGKVQYRSLSVATATAGGNTIPDEMMKAFYDVQVWFGNVRAKAQVVRTATGATLPFPKSTETNSGAILAEDTAATTTVDPATAVVNLSAYKFSSKAVIVSVELLQDSSIDLASYLGSKLGERIARIQNNKFTVGAGTTEPQGVVVGSAAGATATATNAFTLDDVITLIHSVDPAYRPRAEFMLHDTIAAYVRKLKDGQGRYLWEMSTQVGQPDRLFGYPVNINNDMETAITTGKKLMLFGMYNPAFLIRDAGGTTFIRSDEKYVLEHQVVFLAYQRADSAILDSTAIKHMKLA